MKKFFPLTLAAVTLSLAAAAAFPQFAQAAPGAHTAHAGGHRLKKLASTLDLTSTQKTQLKPMLKSAGEQAKAIKSDASLTSEAKKDKLKELRKSTKQEMMSVLTPDQREKLKAMRQQRRAARADKA